MRITAATLALFLFIACGDRETATSTATTSSPAAATAATLTPEELGELGAKIQKEPARANELLSERGLTEESFEKAIRDVTENAEASKRYAAAYKKAGA